VTDIAAAEAVDTDSLASRGEAVGTGLPKSQVQSIVNGLKANWKNAPEIIVVEDMNDPAIREVVRNENKR